MHVTTRVERLDCVNGSEGGPRPTLPEHQSRNADRVESRSQNRFETARPFEAVDFKF
jgi:hypothetical protein